MARTGASRGAGPLGNAVLIAGPTASGKSALALRIAGQTGGTVVNADSMQVYSVLDRLTARPGPGELAAAPHRLYGHVSPAAPYSTGRWLADVKEAIAEGVADRGPAIFVGGTGLYFTALLDGLSEMPAVPEEVRANWRARLAEEGAPALYRLLGERDPDGAARLQPADGQRIVRALEVLEASGRPIGAWQGTRGEALVDRGSARMVVIEPDREELGRRIGVRLRAMVEQGALEEVRALLALDLDPALPAMKAIGVRELAAALNGDIPLDPAIEAAAAATRRYAKRQATWFRHQLGAGWRRITNSSEFSLN
jgi:tRNA dimethylallyltransferase